jgi:hypothetical protein
MLALAAKRPHAPAADTARHGLFNERKERR